MCRYLGPNLLDLAQVTTWSELPSRVSADALGHAVPPIIRVLHPPKLHEQITQMADTSSKKVIVALASLRVSL